MNIYNRFFLRGGVVLEKLLAVFDTDVLYASRLLEFLKTLKWEGFEIMLFTKEESLLDFLKYQSVEILLYGGESSPEDLPKDNIKYIIWLSADMRQGKNKQEIIYKYQSAQKIGTELLSQYTRLEDVNQQSEFGEANLITVFSPIPGEEKISYAWSMAKELSNRRKVLFVSFEQLPTGFVIQGENSKPSMSEFLYYLKESNIDHMEQLKAYINYWERLSYLSGPSHGFDLLSISREDVSRLLEEIKNCKEYQQIIFYLGIYTEASMEILSSSDEVYIAIRDGPYEERIEKEWERQMGLTGIKVEQLNHHIVKLPVLDMEGK